MTYASTVWAESAFKSAKNRNKANSTQRLIALCICRAFLTVSSDACLVLAKTPPIDLLVAERVRIRRRLTEGGTNTPLIKREERSKTLEVWQARWESSEKGSWTRKLLPALRRWYFADVTPTFQLTEALTGHGSFQAYLTKMKRARVETCLYCAFPSDTAAHTLFNCPRWDNLRLGLGQF